MKAKFKVGQVVMILDGWQNQRATFKICGRRQGKDAPEYWDWWGNLYSEVALRSLTTGEIGPRPRKGKGKRQ